MIRLMIVAMALAMTFALTASPVVSQKMKDPKKEQAPKKKEDDKDYKAAVDRIPDQKFDPWRNMR
jgi:multidrug efflux pump subunit AcrB